MNSEGRRWEDGWTVGVGGGRMGGQWGWEVGGWVGSGDGGRKQEGRAEKWG